MITFEEFYDDIDLGEDSLNALNEFVDEHPEINIINIETLFDGRNDWPIGLKLWFKNSDKKDKKKRV